VCVCVITNKSKNRNLGNKFPDFYFLAFFFWNLLLECENPISLVVLCVQFCVCNIVVCAVLFVRKLGEGNKKKPKTPKRQLHPILGITIRTGSIEISDR